MALAYQYDQTFSQYTWWDPLLTVEGWFDREFVGSFVSPPAGGFQPAWVIATQANIIIGAGHV